MSGAIIEKFQKLFNGLPRAFGQCVPTPGKPGEYSHNTSDTPHQDVHWENHLQGTVGLGIVPIRDDGTVVFGVIDIDIDDIDHVELAKKVEKLNLPLYVCRSKSGGAHLYLFIRDPGRQATMVVSRLRQYAIALGFSKKTEIFPKQTYLAPDQTGNWINLPYFGGYTETNRFCVKADGTTLSLSEFLDHVVPWDGSQNLPLPVMHGSFEDGPPCLEKLLDEGVETGNRNNAMYDIGVFLKKAYPESWKTQMRDVNQKYLSKSLPDKELGTIIKSLSKSDYFYKCEEEPIVNYCNKDLCKKRQYGIGHKNQAQMQAGLVHPDFQQLEKLKSDPPRWYLTVNGVRLDISSEEFFNFKKFKFVYTEVMDEVPIDCSNREWDRVRATLLQNVIIHDVPPEATNGGQALLLLDDWVSQGSPKEDYAVRGEVWIDNGYAYLQLPFFEKYLYSHGLEMKTNQIVSLLKLAGWEDTVRHIEKRKIQFWRKPYDGPDTIPNQPIADDLNDTREATKEVTFEKPPEHLSLGDED